MAERPLSVAQSPAASKRIDLVDWVGSGLVYSDDAFLRVLTPADITAAYVEGLNDPEVFKNMGGTRITRQTAGSVAQYVSANLAAPDAILFGHFIEGVLRGTIRIYEVDNVASTAIIGTVLFDKTVWGLGRGSRALQTACRFCFETLALRMVIAGIYSCNEASRKSFARAGFVHDPFRDREDEFDRIETWIATPENFATQSANEDNGE